MKEIAIPAYAKINITLDITGKRPNGYHELESLMQQVALHDDVIVQVSEGSSISLSCDRSEVPLGEENIAFKAAREFLAYIDKPCRVAIKIVKRIPIAGGMAGGSTNAAAVLTALNKLLGYPVRPPELMDLGLKLGADVPFCIAGGTAIARGIGEELAPCEAPPQIHLVLLKPDFGVSTAQVYQNYNFDKVFNRPELTTVLEGFRKGCIDTIYKGMGNVLESVTMELHPILKELRSNLYEWGAAKVMMSGSGPTLLAFTDSCRAAKELAQKVSGNLPSSYQVVVTNTLGSKEGGKAPGIEDNKDT